jgi:probable HAF family extracellular repeat protein
MKTCKSLLLFLGFVSAFLMAATAAGAPTLTFKFTEVSVPGALATDPGGVNNSGTIVGEYEDKKNIAHCFMLADGKVTTINHPKAASDTCIHINSAGGIVGAATNSAGVPKGFLYQNGKFTDIPGPSGAAASAANGINDSGLIVGDYADSSGVYHGFLLKGRTYKTLDVPGAGFTIATGINNTGDIVLFWIKSAAVESSLYNGKTYRTINVPGAANSEALDINNVGDIVYDTFDSSGQSQGALFHSGKYYTFDYPKSADTGGFGINDHKLLVGFYETTNNGPDRGFKAAY